MGGALSPLLANVYLHWFDKRFHAPGGPAHFAKAKLVRYADDFVVLARYQGPRLRSWVEETLEGWLGLEINRVKTKVVNLAEEGAGLDFLGYHFRYEQDLYGGSHRYLRWGPSVKTLARLRERVRQLTDRSVCWVPPRAVIATVNRFLVGWRAYFSLGHCRRAYRSVNYFVDQRLIRHLRRRSQRPFRPPEGTSYSAHLVHLGLLQL